MPTVTHVDGSNKEVKNLGWLLRNRNNHCGIREVIVKQKPNFDATLVVTFSDGIRYTCEFANYYACFNFTLRYLRDWMPQESLDRIIDEAIDGGSHEK